MADKKLFWLSNAPWAASGYGSQSAMFLPRIRDYGYDVAIGAFYGLEGGMAAWKGMPVYPTDHTRLLKFRLPQYVKRFAGSDHIDACQVITLMDAWTWGDVRFGGSAYFEDLKMAAWVPIDHEPAPSRVMEALAVNDAWPIAMSQFGYDAIEEAGKLGGHDFHPLYVPHGVETEFMQPRDRNLMRKSMKLPEDVFIVGMVANNQGVTPSRKSFPEVFQAFAYFQKQHDDAYLYLHCDTFGFNDGVNLLTLADAVGIPSDRIAAVDQLSYHLGTIHPETLSYVYSAFDVLANPAYGEGFGIPIVEAQACGTPVIITEWTAMRELRGAGWFVQGDRHYDVGHGAFFMRPSVMEIYEAMEKAYQARGDQKLRDQAVEFAKQYDADHVFDTYWKPTLAALEEGRPDKQFPEVKLNRAQRRAQGDYGKAKVAGA